jgi:gamma-glutamylcyclotransferase (GGCT)/AIG2-like uncharacterized protein YtfP
VFGRVAGGTVDVLGGYRLSVACFEGICYPNIIPDAEGSVEGLVFEVCEEELCLIDEYERPYRRVRKVLESGRRAWVYIF